MNAAPEKPKIIEIPEVTTDEAAIVSRLKSGTGGRATLREFLEFIARRRRIIDELVREVYPEWPK